MVQPRVTKAEWGREGRAGGLRASFWFARWIGSAGRGSAGLRQVLGSRSPRGHAPVADGQVSRGSHEGTKTARPGRFRPNLWSRNLGCHAQDRYPLRNYVEWTRFAGDSPLSELYSEANCALDDLPFTKDFELLYTQLPTRADVSLDRHYVCKALYKALKASKLIRNER